MAVTLYLTRHGQTEWNVKKRIQGQTDTQLTPTGEQQAGELREYFRKTSLEAVYASNLLRAINTAKIVAEPHGLPVQINSLLRERSYGSLEGRFIADYKSFFDTPETSKTILPGTEIEVEHEAAKRFTAVLSELEDRSLIVAHAGIILAFLKVNFPDSHGSKSIYDIPNCGIWEVERSAAGYTLVMPEFPLIQSIVH